MFAACGVMLIGARAHAEPGPSRPAVRHRFHVEGEERLLRGVGDRSDMTIGLYRVGVGFRAVPTLDVAASLSVLVTAGSASMDALPAVGAGGELSLTFCPLPAGPARPYSVVGVGLELFPGPRFLPGGDVYEFNPYAGIGLDISLDRFWTVGALVYAAHVSNGQGLGAFNPSFDGFGGGLKLSRSLSERSDVDDPWTKMPSRPPGVEARPSWVPGISAEGRVGYQSGVVIATGRAVVAEALTRMSLLEVDGESGVVDGIAYVEVGAAVVGHLGFASVGFRGGYRRFAGLETAIVVMQAEGHLSKELSIVGMVQYERTLGLARAVLAAAGARFYPLPSLALDVGMGFDALGAGEDERRPYFDVEWAVPIPDETWQASLYIGREASGFLEHRTG